MTNYEMVAIFNPETAEDARNTILERLKDAIEENGEVVEVDEWGNRRLAYEINHIRDGYYVVINFKTNPEDIQELQRRASIADDIIRFMIVNLED